MLEHLQNVDEKMWVTLLKMLTKNVDITYKC
jgi:hypothetical protein